MMEQQSPLLQFQSTLSIQRVTQTVEGSQMTTEISIHTLHTESDVSDVGVTAGANDFNPHSPYRE